MAAKSLILVESGNKAKTLKKLLGGLYTILSTEGFLKAMPKSRLAIDEANNYAADYKTIRGQGSTLQMLKKITSADDTGRIYIAANAGGEGEFWANQCCEIFGINEESRCRVVFNELTKDAVKTAIANARPIDINLANAYQAKQLVDKIASHKIGEYFSYKVWRGNKVGRFRAMLLKLVATPQPARTFEISKNLNAKNLQILAARDLKFSTAKTRLVAAQLYEGITLDKTCVGLITFPAEEIKLTDKNRTPESVKDFLNVNQFKLYQLIYSALTENFSTQIELDGACNDLSLMAALDNLQVDWAEYFSVGISSLIKRQYIEVENGVYKVTDLGEKILAALDGFFDEDFSAAAYNNFNSQVQKIAEGKADKISVIKNYCANFNKHFEKAMASLPPDAKIQEAPVIETDEICDKCGNKMLLKHGRYGNFLACSNYPECKNIKPYLESVAQVCPKCGGKLAKRIFRGGRSLYTCQNCEFSTWDEPLEKPCKVCNSTMFIHKFKGRAPMIYCGNENCTTRHDHPINKIIADAQKRRDEKSKS